MIILIFEELLTDALPFVAQVFKGCQFDFHMHHEIEIIYCLKGKVSITIEAKTYALNKGDFIIITPMMPHEAIHNIPETEVLLLKIGPVFLRNTFSEFVNLTFENLVFSFENPKENWSIKTKELLDEITDNCINSSPASMLTIIGDIYKLCAVIINNYPHSYKKTQSLYQDYQRVEKILEIFEYIHLHYMENIDIDKAAKIVGYSKGHFCKIFKATTGYSFHTYLNRYRIKNAMFLLSKT